MQTSLLVITPQASFGNHIRKGLDSSRFDVFATADFSDAIHFVRRTNCPTAILDAELEDVELSVMDIGFALRQIRTDIQFVLISRPGQAVGEVASLSPAATLSKPISLADLGKLLDRLALPVIKTKPVDPPMPESVLSERTLTETSQPNWLKDVSKAAQHLTRLTLESSAQAALITQQNELWAYAGQLSREAAQELTESVQRYWDNEDESDLLRFVRLQSTAAQHMLYARKLSIKMMLVLVFDAETPFSTIRAQAGRLVKNLSENPADEMGIPSSSVNLVPVKSNNFEAPESNEDEGDFPPISELLGDVPSPNPPRQQTNLSWDQPSSQSARQQTTVDEPQTTTPAPVLLPDSRPQALPQFSFESSPPVVQRAAPIKRPIPAMDETFAIHLPTETKPPVETRVAQPLDELTFTRKQESYQVSEPFAETRPQTLTESATEAPSHRILLEPASPALSNLTYACMLIPRFNHHKLVGDSAERLSEWVPQICVAFGWRLEQIMVRPEYLEWVIRVPPSTAPGYVMRVIRKHTSDRIFGEIPRFKTDNPSGDFWAPGYLITGRSQAIPQEEVRKFIRDTRIRQGLIHD